MDELANRSPYEVAVLGEREARQRLDLLASASRILDAAIDDYETAVRQVVEGCVPAFADLCAVEVVEADGEIRTVAYRTAPTSGLHVPDHWTPVARQAAPDRRPVLAYRSGDVPAPAQSVRERLGAQSLMVAPITGGELTLGWFVAATGPYRRGFRQSALRIGVELSSRMGATIQRVGLLRDMQAAAREQTRAVRRLRRLATAATNLAGAAGTEAVLRIACVEACLIQEADGAIARWWRADGSLVSAQTGGVDLKRGEKAFAAVANERAARGRGWIAHSLPTSDPWQRAALVVFLGKELSEDEELVLTSLVSLVPVAFERALGTEAVVAHDSRLRAVVEASPVALIGVRSDDGAVALANQAALALFGWGPDPESWVLGEPLRPDVLELAQAVQSSGAVVTRTASIAGYDLSLSGAPLPPTAGPDDHAVLIAGLDLSQVRRAERTLAQAQRLEVVESATGRLAHDFNNLLTLIIGYSELLGRGLSDPHLRDLADGIADAARRGTALTEQMAGVSRGAHGGGGIADLAAEVRGLDAVLTRLAGPDVMLRIVAPDRPVKIRMDPGEVEQIVINLVMNVCEATEARGAIEVSVESPVASGVLLSVSASKAGGKRGSRSSPRGRRGRGPGSDCPLSWGSSPTGAGASTWTRRQGQGRR